MATKREIVAAVNALRKTMSPEFTADMKIRPNTPGNVARVKVLTRVEVVNGSKGKYVDPPTCGTIVAFVDGAWCGGWILDFGDLGIGHVGYDEGATIQK